VGRRRRRRRAARILAEQTRPRLGVEAAPQPVGGGRRRRRGARTSPPKPDGRRRVSAERTRCRAGTSSIDARSASRSDRI
jgi:hypothetical protein